MITASDIDQLEAAMADDAQLLAEMPQFREKIVKWLRDVDAIDAVRLEELLHTSTEPWIAKKQGPMYYGYVVIDGEHYLCDCSIRCRKCRACLGCLRKLAIDIDTGEITPTPCEKGGTHEPEWDTEPGAPLHPCDKITDGRAGTSRENPQASLKGEGGQTPRPGAGSGKANLSEPVRRLLDDPA